MKKQVVTMAAAALGVIALLGQARAQTPPFVYSVKFVCGLQVVPSLQFPPPHEPSVKPGNYATAINVHNYHNVQVVLRLKKAVIARPESVMPRGPISKLVTGEPIDADRALTVDCNEIALLYSGVTLPPFIEGFVEIVSPLQLSVVAVYTTQTCTNPVNKCSILGDLAIEVVPQSAFRDQ